MWRLVLAVVFFFEVRHVKGVTRLLYPSEAMKVGTNGKIKGRTYLKKFKNNLAHSCGGGVGNYPKMNMKGPLSPGYEGFTAWRCNVGIGIHNSRSWPIVNAKLVQVSSGFVAGGITARANITNSIIVSGKEGKDGTGRDISAPFIMNKPGNTHKKRIREIFSDTDLWTLNWVRCFGGYSKVSQSRFHEFVWDSTQAWGCSPGNFAPLESAVPNQDVELKYQPEDVNQELPSHEGFRVRKGWIPGNAKGNRKKYTLDVAIKICIRYGSACGGVSCRRSELYKCGVHARGYTSKAKGTQYVSWVKDPGYEFNAVSTTVAPQSSLWVHRIIDDRHCPFFRFAVVEEGLATCQKACEGFAFCVGVMYIESQDQTPGLARHCWLCDRDASGEHGIPAKNALSFFARPGGSHVPSFSGYGSTVGWLGGFARGNWAYYSLEDGISKCNEYGPHCGGITCKPDLSRCQVRQQSWIRGGTDSVTFLKGYDSELQKQDVAEELIVEGSMSVSFQDTSFMDGGSALDAVLSSMTATVVEVTNSADDGSLSITGDDVQIQLKKDNGNSRRMSTGVQASYTISVTGPQRLARANLAMERIEDAEDTRVSEILRQAVEDAYVENNVEGEPPIPLNLTKTVEYVSSKTAEETISETSSEPNSDATDLILTSNSFGATIFGIPFCLLLASSRL